MMNKMKIHPRSIIKDKMNIEKDKMGFVLGRGSSNLKRLKEIYGVEVTPPDKGEQTIYIEGIADMVFAAKKDIEDCIQYTTRFIIEKEYVSAVIGSEGKRIEALRKANKATYIDIKRDGQVTITGSKKCCESAKEAIESRIQRRKTALDYVYEEKFSVPVNLLGHVVGKNFSNLIRLESTYSVHVHTSEQHSDHKEISVKGSLAENVSAAKKDILENLMPLTLSIDIDASYFGCIKGRRGENVKRLRNEHGVGIFLKNGKVCILGGKGRAEAAREAILSIISEKRKKADAAAAT